MTVLSAHRMVDSSIDGEPLKAMLAGQTADIMYTDPPWDDANAVRLQGMKWTEFMRQLLVVIEGHVDGWVFIEMGQRHVDEAAKMLCETLTSVQVHDAIWGDSKVWLLAGNTCGSAAGFEPPRLDLVSGRRQVNAVVTAVAHPGQTLLDPCCMNVHSAQVALANHLTFLGASTHRADQVRKVLER